MTALREVVDGCGRVQAGLAIVHGVDLSKIHDDELATAMQFLAIQARLAERARRKIVRELTARARVRALASASTEAV